MTILKKILIVLGLLIPVCSYTQDVGGNIEQIIADIYEQLAEENEIDFESLYDDLMQLTENPININNATAEDLEKLQFLSEIQIDNILYYLYKNKSLHTIYELQLIDGLDMTDIRRMLPFVYLGKSKPEGIGINWRDAMKYGKNELFFRLDRGLEKRDGFKYLNSQEKDAEEKNSKKYLGDPYYNYLKYRFRYKDRIQFGVTNEKDVGEQFWGNRNKGYDSFTGYLELRDIGKIKRLVVGDFRANFGQGLIMRSDFSMGKSAYVMQVAPRSSGLKKFSSTSEYDIFRGAGLTFRMGRIDLTAFYSGKSIDADTLNGTFPTIIKSGLHRTESEISKKNTVFQQIIGGNINYSNQWVKLGATTYYTHFNHKLTPNPASYNQFYFNGNEQWAASINYKTRWQKLTFFGETALSDKLAVASTNTLTLSPISRVNLVMLHRYFSKEFDVLYARTFSESSRVNNETGTYVGVEVFPIIHWKISAYADSYRFDWMKFGIDAPSTGKDMLIQADYTPQRNLSMYWRFKHEVNARNYTDTLSTMPILTNQIKWQARFQLNYSFGNFSFRNQLDANRYRSGMEKATFGFSALQDISYKFSTVPLNMNLRFQVFDAQNYNNRIYSYEKDVLYAFSIPMNYGLGARYYLNLRYDLRENLSLWLKMAQSVYADDRTSVGSGNEETEGNRRTDMRFLIRWKF